MRALERLSQSLLDPRVRGLDPDSPEFLLQHQKILQTKPMMHQVFLEFYQCLRRLDEENFHTRGPRLEVGAGVSFIKSVYPDVIVSDIKPGPHLDQIVDAQNLPFANQSLRAIYGINCFHHFPDVRRFFSELNRVLPEAGGAILIEPHCGPIARLLYRHLHKSETYDASQVEWTATANAPTNQALSYLVFIRDRAQFDSEFPQLEIVQLKTIGNYLRYLLSGGLNFNPLIPNWAVPAVRFFEFILKPIESLLALHCVIVIRKKSNPK